jgi:hypothetical protein
MDASTQKLIQALEAADDPKLQPIIEKARSNAYHEFKTELMFPIRQLVEDLNRAGHKQLAQQAMDGNFDATEEEAREWSRSAEGQATFAELVKPQSRKSKPKGFG